MRYKTTVKGGFTINPPITWKELAEAGYANGYNNPWTVTKILITEAERETDEGILIIRKGTWIVPVSDVLSQAGTLVQDVQTIIDAFPDHTYEGCMECFGEEPGDMWRVYIKNHKAYRVDPEIRWPEDPRAEN